MRAFLDTTPADYHHLSEVQVTILGQGEGEMSAWLLGTIQLLWWPRRHCLAAVGRWPRVRPDKTDWGFLPIFWFIIIWPFEVRLLRHIPNDTMRERKDNE